MRELSIEEYIKEFRAYMEEVTSTEEKATEFFVRAGIHTPTGRLKKVYYHQIKKAETKK